jgi:hypothetical protein
MLLHGGQVAHDTNTTHLLGVQREGFQNDFRANTGRVAHGQGQGQ